jgi:hypothetical protein
MSYEERARQDAIREQQYQAGLAGTCQGFGFVRGTPEFSQCMLQLHQAEEQRRAAIDDEQTCFRKLSVLTCWAIQL